MASQFIKVNTIIDDVEQDIFLNIDYVASLTEGTSDDSKGYGELIICRGIHPEGVICCNLADVKEQLSIGGFKNNESTT